MSIDQIDKIADKPYHTCIIGITDQLCFYKTFRFRVKDATSSKRLDGLAQSVNIVWNYCNEISGRSADRGSRWITKAQLRDLTKGAGPDLRLPSQGVQEVIDEFIAKRRAQGRPKLRWRGRRSLGWVPFTNQDIALDSSTAVLRGQRF